MKITIIVGPRRSGKTSKARELASARGEVWREYECAPGTTVLKGREVMKDGKPPPTGMRYRLTALLFENAHETTADMFLRMAGKAVDDDADLIVTTAPPSAECAAWICKLMQMEGAEVITMPSCAPSLSMARMDRRIWETRSIVRPRLGHARADGPDTGGLAFIRKDFDCRD